MGAAEFDSISNRGEYFSAHYFAERLTEDLKKALFATWTLREGDKNDPRATPRQLIRALRGKYLTGKVRGYFAGQATAAEDDRSDFATYRNVDWPQRVADWHQDLLAALGFPAEGPTRQAEITVRHSGREHQVPVAYAGNGIVALDCGWAADNDAALDAEGSGRLLKPLKLSNADSVPTGEKLASWLFTGELAETLQPPRFVLLLLGGVVILADRNTWRDGRYLVASLDAALERNDQRQSGELATIAALFGMDMLRPGENGEDPAIDALLKASSESAVGVSAELRHGLQRSVEIIANEVLARMRQAEVTPEQLERGTVPFDKQLTRESLRFLYRILFLLYAEARPELGILPSDDGTYEAGYSMGRLRELVARDEQLTEERTKTRFHLYESLDVLFTKVNVGHRAYGTEPEDDQPGDDAETRDLKAKKRSEDRGLRFEPLRSELFEPTSIRLIGWVDDPRVDSEDGDDGDARGRTPQLDLRLRNAALHEVLRLLTMKKPKRGERGGFISYRNLGINQLGAVYEGLMSYTGFLADEELREVAKNGVPKDGSWVVPLTRINQYAPDVCVQYDEDDNRRGLRGPKKYPKGSFVYRLAGRDRQTSASYYTPESLTKVTVELALKHRLDQDRDDTGAVIRTSAAELLNYKICEPALGSGAFLNEAINQVAAEYLKRRAQETGVSVPTEHALTELQKVKAYIALHNAYGVDLNATGVELAEVSLWLNTMHPGMHAPWFGLHLRRGNSLIGGRRAVYPASDVAGKEWLKTKDTLAPTELPFLHNRTFQPLPYGAVHQFLLPAAGWAAVAKEPEAKALAPVAANQLAEWKRGILKPPTKPSTKTKTAKKASTKTTQLDRIQAVARRAEFLWDLVVRRMEISEKEIARKIDVWGTDPDDPQFAFMHRPEHPLPKEKVLRDLFDSVDTPYWRLKTIMDAWCALWFWPVDKAGLLDGTDDVYQVTGAEAQLDLPETGPERPAPVPLGSVLYEQASLFPVGGDEVAEGEPAADEDTITITARARRRIVTSPVRPKPKRRTKIPLAEFEDWLDFAESLLGAYDLPAGSMISHFTSLDELEEYEDLLPGYMGMESAAVLPLRFPWLDSVRKIASEQGFFHWELNYAYVFRNRGGFDLQIGNPPWVRPRWDEAVVLAELEPWFKLSDKPPVDEWDARKSAVLSTLKGRQFFLHELVAQTATNALYAHPSTYELLVGTQPNLYRAFMIRSWANANSNGISGLIHPDTHFGGSREGALRGATYRRLRVHAHFINGANWAFATPISRALEFGLHIYGSEQEINFQHLTQLYGAKIVSDSLIHDGSGEVPGIKRNGTWDMRPHRERVIQVNREVLAGWQKLGAEVDLPADQAKLLYPVTAAEQSTIAALSQVALRLGAFDPKISRGYDQTNAKNAGLIRWETKDSGDWSEVILQGPNFSIATPVSKKPNIPCRNQNDYSAYDLTTLPEDATPLTNYQRATDSDSYRQAQDQWWGRCYTDYYRLAWREMVPTSNERSLFAALIPPGAAHIHAVQSMALPTSKETAFVAGCWATLPVDYWLRATGREHLGEGDALTMPAVNPDHPLSQPVLLRTLRLNCLTTAYAPIWAEIYDGAWAKREQWAVDWPGLKALGAVSPEWRYETPLRTARERRAALVELDALVAVLLGIAADGLIAIYQSRYPILSDREDLTWFDAAGRKIAMDPYTYGLGQNKEHFVQLQEYLADPDSAPVPDGYTAPFYRADREREMREAHAVFQARLDAAVAAGEWDPVKQEVPTP